MALRLGHNLEVEQRTQHVHCFRDGEVVMGVMAEVATAAMATVTVMATVHSIFFSAGVKPRNSCFCLNHLFYHL